VQLIPYGGRDHPSQEHRSRQPTAAAETGVRNLVDHGGDLLVGSGQRRDVPTAERGSPQGDPVPVDTGQAAGVGDRGPPIPELSADVHQLAWLTLAGPEVPIVEDQDRQTSSEEPPCVGVESGLPGEGEPVSQAKSTPQPPRPFHATTKASLKLVRGMLAR